MATRRLVLLAVILASCDQLTKHLARMGLDRGVPHVIIPDFFRITLNFNEGIAWGMLPQWSEYFTYFAIVMVLVILMILRKLDRDEVWLKIALAFQMAGAIGNMSDRLLYHRVTDFIDVTLFPHTTWQYEWPIFNLADSFVVVGTVVLVMVLAFTRDRVVEVSEPLAPHPGGLASLGEAGQVSSDEAMAGSVAHEEGLTEIPVYSGTEMLLPFEDENGVAREDLEEPLGSTDDEVDRLTDRSYPTDRPDKLDELSKRPEPES